MVYGGILYFILFKEEFIIAKNEELFEKTNEEENKLYFNQGLRELDVSKLDISKLTNMGYMFANYCELTNLDLSNWDTSKVTDMGSMLRYCNALTTLDLSNWDTSNVTNMNSTFDSCKSLTTVTGIIDMRSCNSSNCELMFNKCPNLTGIKIKNPPPRFTNDYASEISSGKIIIVQ